MHWYDASIYDPPDGEKVLLYHRYILDTNSIGRFDAKANQWYDEYWSYKIKVPQFFALITLPEGEE